MLDNKFLLTVLPRIALLAAGSASVILSVY